MVSQSEVLPMIMPTSGSLIVPPWRSGSERPRLGGGFRLGNHGLVAVIEARRFSRPSTAFSEAWIRAMARPSRQEQSSGAMSDRLSDTTDADGLIEEVERLRAKVAQLQERVEQLDELAHQDTLMNLPNR